MAWNYRLSPKIKFAFCFYKKKVQALDTSSSRYLQAAHAQDRGSVAADATKLRLMSCWSYKARGLMRSDTCHPQDTRTSLNWLKVQHTWLCQATWMHTYWYYLHTNTCYIYAHLYFWATSWCVFNYHSEMKPAVQRISRVVSVRMAWWLYALWEIKSAVEK